MYNYFAKYTYVFNIYYLICKEGILLYYLKFFYAYPFNISFPSPLFSIHIFSFVNRLLSYYIHFSDRILSSFLIGLYLVINSF